MNRKKHTHTVGTVIISKRKILETPEAKPIPLTLIFLAWYKHFNKDKR